MKDIQNAVILVDKPAGLTSNEVIKHIKRNLRVRKIGHSGTLDKFASGLLVICTGNLTKLTRFFLEHDKSYKGVIKLGKITDTGDPEGEVIDEKSFNHVSKEMVKGIFKKYQGEIEQMPPLYSALKIQGKRASDLVRQGKEAKLEPRKITVYENHATGVDLAAGTIDFKVFCSKGTYVRSLARDIGSGLDSAAYLSSLRRLQSGPFDVNNACSLIIDSSGESTFALNETCVLSAIEALAGFGKITVSDPAAERVLNGTCFLREDVLDLQKGDKKSFIILNKKENLIAIADIDIEKWHIIYLNVFNR